MPPVSPVRGRFAHLVTFILSAVALIVYFVYEPRKTRAKS